MRISFLILLLTLLNSGLYAQEQAGKIITNSEALSLFGEPDFQLKFQSSLLQEFSEKSKNLLFTIIDQKILIVNQNKKVLFPENYELKGDELFHLYNSSIVLELIHKSNDEYVLIELRGEVLTITNNSFTLEFGVLCPPNCY